VVGLSSSLLETSLDICGNLQQLTYTLSTLLWHRLDTSSLVAPCSVPWLCTLGTKLVRLTSLENSTQLLLLPVYFYISGCLQDWDLGRNGQSLVALL